jgi:hypothetical protein
MITLGDSTRTRNHEYLSLEPLQGATPGRTTTASQSAYPGWDQDHSTESLLEQSNSTQEEHRGQYSETPMTARTPRLGQSATGYGISASVEGHRGWLTKYKSHEIGEQFSLTDWQWEIAAATFSAICFAAVVIVLVVFRNRSLSDWNFMFDASLNTLIATLSTLSRTALLVPVASCISQLKWVHFANSPRSLREVQIFDDASRGPFGGLELIWKFNKNIKLATWGSVVTILTLAMGPFAQQLLSYPSRRQISVTVPQAVFYGSSVYESRTFENAGQFGKACKRPC